MRRNKKRSPFESIEWCYLVCIHMVFCLFGWHIIVRPFNDYYYVDKANVVMIWSVNITKFRSKNDLAMEYVGLDRIGVLSLCIPLVNVVLAFILCFIFLLFLLRLRFSHMIFHFDINCAFVMHDEIYVFFGIFCIFGLCDTTANGIRR